MVNTYNAAADPRLSRNKRPRVETAPLSTPQQAAEEAIEIGESLGKAFETVQSKAKDCITNHNTQLQELLAYIERLEKVHESQTSSMRRENMAKTQQAKDLERSLKKLQDDTAIHPTLLANARLQAANWRERHESLFKSHKNLVDEWERLRADTKRVDDKYEPVNKRLAELKNIGQRTHDTIIRRVDRLTLLYQKARSEGLTSKKRKGTEMEMFDLLQVISSQWEAMVDDYNHATNGGQFKEETPEEGEIDD